MVSSEKFIFVEQKKTTEETQVTLKIIFQGNIKNIILIY